ncbi:MAG: hypothetical protein NTU76_02685 [Candidatus Taylorbacteria bacterium]|nr:hypothetical protein [Candidatus Taylorbacteria bacterium]
MSKSNLADNGMVLTQIGQKIAHAVVDNGGSDSNTKTVLLKTALANDIALLILGKAKIVMIEVPKSLRLVKSGIAVPAVTEPFVVADHFQVNIGDNVAKPWKKGEVKISNVGDNFKCLFGQVVPVRDGQVMSCHQLTKKTCDTDIRDELGLGIETDLAGLWHLLEQQPEGDKGVLHTNSRYANIFYITDKNGVVRAVFACWLGGGWLVSSDIFNDRQWRAHCRVFSRNSGNQPL